MKGYVTTRLSLFRTCLYIYFFNQKHFNFKLLNGLVLNKGSEIIYEWAHFIVAHMSSRRKNLQSLICRRLFCFFWHHYFVFFRFRILIFFVSHLSVFSPFPRQADTFWKPHFPQMKGEREREGAMLVKKIRQMLKQPSFKSSGLYISVFQDVLGRRYKLPPFNKTTLDITTI